MQLRGITPFYVDDCVDYFQRDFILRTEFHVMSRKNVAILFSAVAWC